MIAMDMAGHLEDAGAEVLGPVGSLEEALELIEDHAHGIDAAVLDVNLGRGTTSYPVADRLLVLRVPYIFATGDLRVLREATGPILEKPVLAGELVKAVVALLPANETDYPAQSSGPRPHA